MSKLRFERRDVLMISDRVGLEFRFLNFSLMLFFRYIFFEVGLELKLLFIFSVIGLIILGFFFSCRIGNFLN